MSICLKTGGYGGKREIFPERRRAGDIARTPRPFPREAGFPPADAAAPTGRGPPAIRYRPVRRVPVPPVRKRASDRLTIQLDGIPRESRPRPPANRHENPAGTTERIGRDHRRTLTGTPMGFTAPGTCHPSAPIPVGSPASTSTKRSPTPNGETLPPNDSH